VSDEYKPVTVGWRMEPREIPGAALNSVLAFVHSGAIWAWLAIAAEQALPERCPRLKLSTIRFLGHVGSLSPWPERLQPSNPDIMPLRWRLASAERVLLARDSLLPHGKCRQNTRGPPRRY
jgi:hypothetical protein